MEALKIVGAPHVGGDFAAGFHRSLIPDTSFTITMHRELLFTLQLHGVADRVASLWLRSLLLWICMMDFIFLVQLYESLMGFLLHTAYSEE